MAQSYRVMLKFGRVMLELALVMAQSFGVMLVLGLLASLYFTNLLMAKGSWREITE